MDRWWGVRFTSLPRIDNPVRRLCQNRQYDDGKVGSGERFLDWPSSENDAAIHAGLHSLMVLGLKAVADLSEILGDQETKDLCEESISKLKKHVPEMAGS